jgi:pilus assembly protein CpaC
MKGLLHSSWAVLLALGCWHSSAQTTRGRDISLIEGRGELLQFDRDIQKLAIAEPKIADAIVISPHEVMVTAKAPGHTTLVVWETGSEPTRYEIDVGKDTAEWDDFKKQIQQGAPGAEVSVSGSGETIVLSGTVASAEDSKRLASLAQTRSKNVINLLKPPPAPQPRQILLAVKFVDLDRVALTQVGFNLFSGNSKLQGVSSTEQFSSPRIGPLQLSNPNSNSLNFSDLLNLFIFNPGLNIGATIKLLQEHDLAQILAEPNLITLEGKEASFLAGGQFPFPTITTTSTGGAVAPVVTVQFKPFGVKLNFTPTITHDGSIDIQVAPEVSALDWSNAVTLNGFQIPAISQRHAETEVILKDGESFAIAGLIDNRVTEVLDKVPGLGDIPILGKLFQSRSSQKSTDELLVVVTPHFVRPLAPNENAVLPEMPENWLPTVVQQRAKGAKGGKMAPAPATSAPNPPNQPQFVGPSGYEEPK